MKKKIEVGKIYADNIENPQSEKSIRLGFYKGDGLIGKIVEAVQKLEQLALDVGYYDDNPHVGKALKNQRLILYEAIKQLEDCPLPDAIDFENLPRWKPKVIIGKVPDAEGGEWFDLFYSKEDEGYIAKMNLKNIVGHDCLVSAFGETKLCALLNFSNALDITVTTEIEDTNKNYDDKALESIKALNRSPEREEQVKGFYNPDKEEGSDDNTM